MIKRLFFACLLFASTSVNAETVYHYLNSLTDHSTGSAGNNTYSRVPEWAALIAAEDSQTYEINGEFGFVDQWDLPPSAGLSYTHATDAGSGNNNWTTTDAADFTHVYFTGDNFAGPGTPYTDPIWNPPDTYMGWFAGLIDSWEANTDDTIKYRIYEGWGDAGSFVSEPVSGATAQQFIDYKTQTLGTYHDWWVNVVTDLKALRPSADIELVSINTGVFNVIEAIPALDSQTFDFWFEDNAPHGHEEFYLLAGMAYYIDLYQRPIPASWTPPGAANIDSVITNNLQTIKDALYVEMITTPTYSFTGNMSVGTNLSESEYFRPQNALLDLRYQADTSGWVTTNGTGAVIDSDENLTALTTGFATIGVLAVNPSAIEGAYTLLWDQTQAADVQLTNTGTGTLTLTTDESGTGRRVYTLTGTTSPDSISIVVRANAPVTGDFDFHVILPGHETNYNNGELFNSSFLAKSANQRVFRFMDWTGTNNSTVVNPADLASDSSLTWGHAAPFYTTMELMKATGATEAWINIPHQATDATITAIATEVYNAWQSGIRVWVEYSNEVWNSGFTQTSYAQTESNTLYGVGGFSGQGLWVAKRSIDIKNLFQTAFGSDSDAIKLVVAGQADYDSFFVDADYLSGSNPSGCYNACRIRNSENDIHNHVDMYAIAPYFSGTLLEDQATQESRRTDLWTDAEFFNDLNPSIDTLLGYVESHLTNVPTLTGRSDLVFGYYEMGQHITAQWNPGGAYDLRYRDYQNTVEMGDHYRRLIEHALANGIDVIADYIHIFDHTSGFYWGNYENLTETANYRAQVTEAAYLLDIHAPITQATSVGAVRVGGGALRGAGGVWNF